MARTVVFKDQMKHSERMGGQAGIFVTMLIVFFFIAHQVRNTVFFTTGFGPFEMGLFYSSIPFGIVTATARTTPGKRNEIRSLEISGGSLISWIPGLLVKVLLFTGGLVRWPELSIQLRCTSLCVHCSKAWVGFARGKSC